jgi:predicted dehydrogenase
MQHPIGFAVFGAGRMGTLHIANIASHAAAKLVYVVDPDEARPEGVASQFSAKATADTQRPLDDPDVQAVVIVSATNTHVDLIIAAARAGNMSKSSPWRVTLSIQRLGVWAIPTLHRFSCVLSPGQSAASSVRRAVYGYDQRIEVFGSKGMVCSGNVSATTIEKYTNEVTSARDRLLPDFMQRYLPSYARELDSFIQALQTGAVIASDFASGKRALVLADAARTSYLTNKPVSIELQ